MKLTPSKINAFLFLKLPSAYLTGVRVKSISETECRTGVKYKWINTNPFNSMFWAVQGMAAELSTGALVMSKIRNSQNNISMLVASNKATFYKKAQGRIIFTCVDGKLVEEVLKETIKSGEGKTLWMKSEGIDSSGTIVSKFEFEWTLKLR